MLRRNNGRTHQQHQTTTTIAFGVEYALRTTLSRDRTSTVLLYSRSYTIVLFTRSPLAFFPVAVSVRVLPSAEMTACCVMVPPPSSLIVFVPLPSPVFLALIVPFQ